MQEIVAKILGWFAPKLDFLKGVDKDKLTTYLGLAQGVIVVTIQAISEAGWDPTNPASWLAVAFAISTFIKSWATNKA